MENRNASLPDIHTMYDTIRQNKDYNVVRTYNAAQLRTGPFKPTNKRHYLDQSLRAQCSPGPASTPSHIQIRLTN